LKVILTPIETDTYRPLDRAVACATSGLDSRRRYFLYVGRLDDRIKRVSALIHAFAAVSRHRDDVDLLIAGNGPDEGWLQAQGAAALLDRIRFLGWIAEPSRLAALYNAADCIVLPSWSEGFPTVVGEAMACGTPVVASRVGGVSEIVVGARTGWLFKPERRPDGCQRRSRESEPGASHAADVRRMAERSLRKVAADLKACFRSV
jgi:glycosyltransferase involved in cell wall biosynthesis